MPTSDEIKFSIRDFILQQFLPDEDPSELQDNTPLITTGILDSIATLKLVLFLEEQFSVTINPHEANAEFLDTIDKISNLVGSKI